MLVFLCSVLYATQVVVKTCGDGSRLAVFAEYEMVTGVKVIDIGNRTDDGSSAACSGLLECCEFFLRYRATLYGHTEVLGKLHEALVGD